MNKFNLLQTLLSNKTTMSNHLLAPMGKPINYGALATKLINVQSLPPTNMKLTIKWSWDPIMESPTKNQKILWKEIFHNLLVEPDFCPDKSDVQFYWHYRIRFYTRDLVMHVSHCGRKREFALCLDNTIISTYRNTYTGTNLPYNGYLTDREAPFKLDKDIFIGDPKFDIKFLAEHIRGLFR